MPDQQQCIDAYRKHKNLKLAAAEIGMPWQSMYVELRKAGEPVTGDKTRYGSATDRLAAHAEEIFQRLVPAAVNQNQLRWQSPIDFLVNGHSVDVKVSRLNLGHKSAKTRRWAFSLKKQESTADFFVCFCLAGPLDEVARVLLIPGEIARCYSTMSMSEREGGRWRDYEVAAVDLAPFFSGVAV